LSRSSSMVSLSIVPPSIRLNSTAIR
jgi:hypothetical protein